MENNELTKLLLLLFFFSEIFSLSDSCPAAVLKFSRRLEITDFKQEIRDFSYGTSPGEII